jgi:nucleoside-diphosphate-sugar epimerase
MTQTALILGASGRFGRHAADALKVAGWRVRSYDRSKNNMIEAAQGADVIVNGLNPAYQHWARDVPVLTRQVIAAAKASGATVIIPGNVYNFGENARALFDEHTPHEARNPLGRIRVEMEQAYRDAGVKTIILRAGNFLDTQASGNWFDRVMAAKISKGVFAYPGRWDAPGAWAFLPDVGRATAALAEQRDTLGQFEDIPFEGYTLSGEDLAQALERVTGRSLKCKDVGWFGFHLLRPFMPFMKGMIEMRYMWSKPHHLGNKRFKEILPDFASTPLDDALAKAIAPL